MYISNEVQTFLALNSEMLELLVTSVAHADRFLGQSQLGFLRRTLAAENVATTPTVMLKTYRIKYTMNTGDLLQYLHILMAVQTQSSATSKKAAVQSHSRTVCI